MLIQKPIPALLLLCSLCFSQTINISGTVTGTAGTPLAGALVQLEQGGLSDSTGSDGNFLLSGVVGISDKNNQTLPHKLSASIHNGRLVITAAEKSAVKITAFTLRGKAVFEKRMTLNTGTRSLALPRIGAGVYLFRIQSGSRGFIIKSPSIGGASQGATGFVQEFSSAVSARRDIIDDVIKVSKERYLNNRVAVKNSDTSGIEIIMISQDEGTVTDIDGNVYHAIRIGDQVWTVENLRTTRYNVGIPVPHITDSAEWVNDTTGAYCFYNNDSASNAQKYGALYNWYAVNTGKLAPEGWHVPANDEWETLNKYLRANGYNWDGTVEYNRIGKSMAAKTDWLPSDKQGHVGNDMQSNNSSGFTALPCGYRLFNGVFQDQGGFVKWWSATQSSDSTAYTRGLFSGNDYFGWNRYIWDIGFSVRMVKD